MQPRDFLCLCRGRTVEASLSHYPSCWLFPRTSVNPPTHVWDCWVQKACIVKQLRSAAYCLWEGRFLEKEDCPQAVQVFVGRVPSLFLLQHLISLPHLRQADTAFSTSPNSALGHCTRSSISELLILEYSACITTEVSCIQILRVVYLHWQERKLSHQRFKKGAQTGHEV